MYRASTPTHTFKFSDSPAGYSDIIFTYAQAGEKVLEKHMSDGTVTGNNVEITLTVTETNKFKANVPCSIQVRKLTSTGGSFQSKIMRMEVNEVLNDGVI